MLYLRNSRILSAICSCIAFISTSNCLAGGTLYVDDDAQAGGDGLSWDTAYRFLHDAIASVPDGWTTEIHIAQGTYKPDQNEANPKGTGEREATFHLINGVALMGGYAGIGAKDPDARDVDLFPTILSGDLLGDDEMFFENYDENAFHVLRGDDVNETAIVDGLVVIGGNANIGNWPADTASAGGLYLSVGSSPTVIGCQFVRNHCRLAGPALLVREACPILRNCKFIANISENFSPALSVRDSCGTLVINCTFDGGGTANHLSFGNSRGESTLINCRFTGNESRPCCVGNVFNQNGDVTFINCEFFDNKGGAGAGLANTWFGNNENASATLINCTFTNNSGISKVFPQGGAIFNGRIGGDPGTATLIMTNCIVWDNHAHGAEEGSLEAQIWNRDGTVIVNYSNFEGLNGEFGGVGNINIDPQFVATDVGNFRLYPGSPCHDAGDNDAVPIEIVEDITGLPRFADDPEAKDAGNGEFPVVDMGAHEYSYQDCNRNGNSDNADIGKGISSDCNGNFVPDECDVQSGFSADIDSNGVPDECQDCNNNGTFDPIDIDKGFSSDCDKNGVPDECDPDCNGNGIPDACDIADGFSTDCNGNGVPDECDVPAVFEATSGVLSPFDEITPQSFVLKSPPNALSDVMLDFTLSANMQGNFGWWVEVYLNNTLYFELFITGGSNCPDPPDTTFRVMDAGLYNDIVNGGDLVIDFVGHNADPDVCGKDSFISVDIEYLSPSGDPQICPLGDLNGDGVVNTKDLLILFANWGVCGDCNACPADLDGDCQVEINDLSILLDNWG